MFAVPFVGTSAYFLLWLTLPSRVAPSKATNKRRWLVGLVIVGMTGALGSGFLVLPLILAAGVTFVVTQPRGPAEERVRSWRLTASRAAAGVATVIAMLAMAVMWVADDLSAPNVPHRIDNTRTLYCSACHGNPGVARGAPVFDTLEHSGGSACVSCHDHLPPSKSEASGALWPLPLETRP